MQRGEPAIAAIVLPTQVIQDVRVLSLVVPAGQRLILPSAKIEPAATFEQVIWSSVTELSPQAAHTADPGRAAMVLPEHVAQEVLVESGLVPAGHVVMTPLESIEPEGSCVHEI